jgi:hypothetical protein
LGKNAVLRVVVAPAAAATFAVVFPAMSVAELSVVVVVAAAAAAAADAAAAAVRTVVVVLAAVFDSVPLPA